MLYVQREKTNDTYTCSTVPHFCAPPDKYFRRARLFPENCGENTTQKHAPNWSKFGIKNVKLTPQIFGKMSPIMSKKNT